MSVLKKIAFYQGRRDETPNQELARELAASKDAAGIAGIVAHLTDADKNVQSDCLKVLYEIGYIDPALIAPYAGQFLRLLSSRNNRLVWGSMIALATIAPLRAAELYAQLALIKRAMDAGSVITVDNGVKVLAGIAAADAAYGRVIFPDLLQHLSTCRPKEVPQHAESTLVAVTAANKAEFMAVLQKRMSDLSGGALPRIKRVLKEADRRQV